MTRALALLVALVAWYMLRDALTPEAPCSPLCSLSRPC